MHSNDIITNISHQFHANSVHTIIAMQTTHETPLVISIIDIFFVELKVFWEIPSRQNIVKFFKIT